MLLDVCARVCFTSCFLFLTYTFHLILLTRKLSSYTARFLFADRRVFWLRETPLLSGFRPHASLFGDWCMGDSYDMSLLFFFSFSSRFSTCPVFYHHLCISNEYRLAFFCYRILCEKYAHTHTMIAFQIVLLFILIFQRFDGP